MKVAMPYLGKLTVSFFEPCQSPMAVRAVLCACEVRRADPLAVLRSARTGGLYCADRVSSQAVGVTLPVSRGFQNAFGQQGTGEVGLAGRAVGRTTLPPKRPSVSLSCRDQRMRPACLPFVVSPSVPNCAPLAILEYN